MSLRLRPTLCLIAIAVISFVLFDLPASATHNFKFIGKEIIEALPVQCPPATLKIHQPGFICETSDPFQMQLTTVGLSGDLNISWSGMAITDPAGWFDPHIRLIGLNKVYVTVVQGSCVYIDSIVVLILMKEITSFKLQGIPCKDSILQLNFTGYAYGSSNWHYEFDGAESKQVEWPDDYSLLWHEPGTYSLSLWIERHGCVSDTFVLPVIIGQYLEPPQLTCIKEDYYSLEIGWGPVEGANEYLVTNSISSDTISGLTYTLNHLPDNTPVNFEVTALQPGGCGPSKPSHIQCTTLEYITPQVYIPKIFSPNDDGINDVIYVQSNAPVTEVTLFQVFDRWGNMVFEDQHFPPNDPAHGWSGNFSGHILQPGVYAFETELRTTYGETINRKGDITLIK